jgi:hypothetical protein
MSATTRFAATILAGLTLGTAAPAIAEKRAEKPAARKAVVAGTAAATAVTADAAADTDAPDDARASVAASSSAPEPAASARTIHISGYVQPQFGIRYRPGEVPRDRTDYSADQTRAGVVVDGAPIEGWGYALHVVIGGGIVDAVSGEAVDSDGDGDPDEVSFLSRAQTGIELERAAVDWDPTENIGLSAGQMRIPFTVESQIANTSLMFPNRSAANEVFLRGSDLGALARLSLRGGRLRMAAGVWSGTDATSAVEEDARGPLYAVRADIDPMGPLATGGRDRVGGPFRIGVGAGVLYYPATTYDAAGFEGPRIRDLRASVSARAAVHGFYIQGELLRRQRTDSLSSRPALATGAYGQASYYIPVGKSVAISPIARLGWSVEDQSFDPRETMWTEAGASLHLRTDRRDPDDMRLTLQYLGERRLSERESAHGAVAQIQLTW